jgi:hypothetical protein
VRCRVMTTTVVLGSVLVVVSAAYVGLDGGRADRLADWANRTFRGEP